jgi:hypothetical protein
MSEGDPTNMGAAEMSGGAFRPRRTKTKSDGRRMATVD